MRIPIMARALAFWMPLYHPCRCRRRHHRPRIMLDPVAINIILCTIHRNGGASSQPAETQIIVVVQFIHPPNQTTVEAAAAATGCPTTTTTTTCPPICMTC
jgi:hypothetical protein